MRRRPSPSWSAARTWNPATDRTARSRGWRRMWCRRPDRHGAGVAGRPAEPGAVAPLHVPHPGRRPDDRDHRNRQSHSLSIPAHPADDAVRCVFRAGVSYSNRPPEVSHHRQPGGGAVVRSFRAGQATRPRERRRAGLPQAEGRPTTRTRPRRTGPRKVPHLHALAIAHVGDEHYPEVKPPADALRAVGVWGGHVHVVGHRVVQLDLEGAA